MGCSGMEPPITPPCWPPNCPPNGSTAPGAAGQGLTLAHFRAQLDDLRHTSLTLELNLSTIGTHAQVIRGIR